MVEIEKTTGSGQQVDMEGAYIEIGKNVLSEFGYAERIGTEVSFRGITIMSENFLLSDGCRNFVLPVLLHRNTLPIDSEERKTIESDLKNYIGLIFDPINEES